jgi:hypothetical protein
MKVFYLKFLLDIEPMALSVSTPDNKVERSFANIGQRTIHPLFLLDEDKYKTTRL